MNEERRLVRDVVVQTIPLDICISDETFRAHPPLQGKLDLGDELWVGSLGHKTVLAIFDACTPKGLNLNPPAEYGYRYLFVRESSVAGVPSLSWDEDRKLRDCILLSRLIQPTTISTRFSARLSYRNGVDSELPLMIVPGDTQGMSAFAWVNGPYWRNYLTNEDGLALARLISRYKYEDLPMRVRRALRYFELSCLTYYPDARLTQIVVGLESLINTHDKDVKRKFKKRIAKLSTEFGKLIPDDIAGRAYSYRSSLVHGQSLDWDNISSDFKNIYAALELLLRQVLKKCILETAFRSRFESNVSIDTAYPV